MPASPVVRMRAKNVKAMQRRSAEEKEKEKERREKKQAALPRALIWFMVIIILGSTFVQLYYTVTAPHLAD